MAGSLSVEMIEMTLFKLLFGSKTNYGLIEEILIDLREAVKLRWRVFKQQI